MRRYKVLNTEIITVKSTKFLGSEQVVGIKQGKLYIVPKGELFFVGTTIRPAFYSMLKKRDISDCYMEHTLNKHILKSTLSTFFKRNKKWFERGEENDCI